MSIEYKLFRIPTTFDEFVDKVKKKGDNQADVFLESCNEAGPAPKHLDYVCYVGLQSGKTRLIINQHTHVRLGELFHSRLGIAEVEQNAFKEAVEIAEKLQNQGLEATIHGEPLKKARGRIAQYEARVVERK
nr:hypothetical protein [Nanoarchaeota archaeon]